MTKEIQPNELEKYSSAITLSDMEIFVFPDLLYSLVLANLMSPIVWQWRDDKWFRKVKNKSPYRKIQRLKQFIMNNFDFNLDLETWGLTDSEKEIERFAPYIDIDVIRESNALFGYEGDKYYFDMDIRRHFGLDKYKDSSIPYWKTETVEAMRAFRLREGYQSGAGECVSLATLYAAALYVVCDIPLSDIFLMATPLHSQNYIAIDDGILTNNRRIVTKAMMFNGTELTDKAQRALRNERVTIVSHNTGHIHFAYPEASIDKDKYDGFTAGLEEYLTADAIDYDLLINFLRHHSELQGCFQIEFERHGRKRYIESEKVFQYEHSSAYRANLDTSKQLLEEMDEYEFFSDPIGERIILNKFEDKLKEGRVDPKNPASIVTFAESIDCPSNRSSEIAAKLSDFCKIIPRLPPEDKQFVARSPIEIANGMSREDIIDYLLAERSRNPVADLALYAYRDMRFCDWAPYMKAALERNPVCIEGASEMSDEQAKQHIAQFNDSSIYDGARIAQPDEVWNFAAGDGLEKAICLATVMRHRYPDAKIIVSCDGENAILKADGSVFAKLPSSKPLEVEIDLNQFVQER